MKKYDFMILYEVKNREFETVCLLKYELERRGYSVCVVESWQAMREPYDPVSADVMLTFALYNDNQLHYSLSFAKDVKHIINLQWEQIYTNSDLEQASLYQICGKALQAYHVSWGKMNADRLIHSCGVPTDRIIPAGHPALDWTKPLFRGYYQSRQELLEQYGIPCEKKVILFVSSFSYVNLPEVILGTELYNSQANDPRAFQRISVLSQRVILDWFREAAQAHPEFEFIYRPHPAEADNAEIVRMTQEIHNFRVISDYSVKQWISIADKVYTWYSTAVAEMFYFQKKFEILRPLEIPSSMEVTIYNDADFVTEKSVFLQSLVSEDIHFPISEETFSRYYFYDPEKYSYQILCDKCEELLLDARKKTLPAFPEYAPKAATWQDHLLQRTKIAILGLLGMLGSSPKATACLGAFSKKAADRAKFEYYTSQSIKNNGFTARQLEDMVGRITSVILANAEITKQK